MRTAGAALIRLRVLSGSTGRLGHAALPPTASPPDHPPPRCDDARYDSADKGQSKMSQAVGWTGGRHAGLGPMKGGKENKYDLKVVTSYGVSKKDKMMYV